MMSLIHGLDVIKESVSHLGSGQGRRIYVLFMLNHGDRVEMKAPTREAVMQSHRHAFAAAQDRGMHIERRAGIHGMNRHVKDFRIAKLVE